MKVLIWELSWSDVGLHFKMAILVANGTGDGKKEKSETWKPESIHPLIWYSNMYCKLTVYPCTEGPGNKTGKNL